MRVPSPRSQLYVKGHAQYARVEKYIISLAHISSALALRVSEGWGIFQILLSSNSVDPSQLPMRLASDILPPSPIVIVVDAVLTGFPVFLSLVVRVTYQFPVPRSDPSREVSVPMMILPVILSIAFHA